MPLNSLPGQLPFKGCAVESILPIRLLGPRANRLQIFMEWTGETFFVAIYFASHCWYGCACPQIIGWGSASDMSLARVAPRAFRKLWARQPEDGRLELAALCAPGFLCVGSKVLDCFSYEVLFAVAWPLHRFARTQQGRMVASPCAASGRSRVALGPAQPLERCARHLADLAQPNRVCYKKQPHQHAPST